MTNPLLTSPLLDQLLIRPFFPFKSIHFMPDFSMNQITTIIRSPLLMTTTANALGRWYTDVVVQVLMPFDFANTPYISSPFLP